MGRPLRLTMSYFAQALWILKRLCKPFHTGVLTVAGWLGSLLGCVLLLPFMYGFCMLPMHGLGDFNTIQNALSILWVVLSHGFPKTSGDVTFFVPRKLWAHPWILSSSWWNLKLHFWNNHSELWQLVQQCSHYVPALSHTTASCLNGLDAGTIVECRDLGESAAFLWAWQNQESWKFQACE